MIRLDLDMRMPRNCSKCIFGNYFAYCQVVLYKLQFLETNDDKRPDECPLKYVPRDKATAKSLKSVEYASAKNAKSADKYYVEE